MTSTRRSASGRQRTSRVWGIAGRSLKAAKSEAEAKLKADPKAARDAKCAARKARQK